MKNTLLCLLLIAGLTACGGDDDQERSDKNFKATFSVDDLTDKGLFHYYISGDTALIVAEIHDDKVYPFVFDGRCPNRKKEHKKIPNIYFATRGGLEWECIECGAIYSFEKGNPENDIAKGSKLHKYNYNYNEQTGIFNVWW